MKDVANVYVGHVPRLGKAGRDFEDDVIEAIVIMNRTLHTNDVVARVSEAINKINSDGTLPPGVKMVPFYNRTTLVSVTTSTVLHNLLFGCLLIFFLQWIFLGDLRSAIIVGANIPFALFFSIVILVARNVGRWTFVDEIEHDGNVRLGLALADMLGDQPAHIFGERNAELGGLGLRLPLHLGVHGDLGSRIHDGAIMPSHGLQGQATPRPRGAVPAASRGCGRTRSS